MTGEQFNQAARLLFDAAANRWYLSMGLEIAAGMLSVVLSILDVSGRLAVWWAFAGLVLLGIAYFLRLQFEDLHGTAETMRRQAAFTEGLDWPIDEMQANEWNRKLGRTIRERVHAVQRDPDYYDTQKDVGPQRLAEMTIESAFYTRQLYMKLRYWIWWLFGGATAVTAMIVLLTIAQLVPGKPELPIARAVYAFIPVILSANFLGWALALGRLIANIGAIESDLRRIVKGSSASVETVLRVVSEYNCQVEMGLPVHSWLWRRWHNDISDLWDNPFEHPPLSHP
jgi:hypothetical protein